MFLWFCGCRLYSDGLELGSDLWLPAVVLWNSASHVSTMLRSNLDLSDSVLDILHSLLAERALDVTVSAQKRRAWVPNGLKRRENNKFLWRCNNDSKSIRKLTVLSTALKCELKSCISAFSSRCADVKRRSKREDAVLNHSRWFIMTDLSEFIYLSNLYMLYWISVLQ